MAGSSSLISTSCGGRHRRLPTPTAFPLGSQSTLPIGLFVCAALFDLLLILIVTFRLLDPEADTCGGGQESTPAAEEVVVAVEVEQRVVETVCRLSVW